MDNTLLRQELYRCLKQLNAQIEEVRKEAVRTSTSPVIMKNSQGDYIWERLVVAKAQVLNGLVQTREREERVVFSTQSE